LEIGINEALTEDDEMESPSAVSLEIAHELQQLLYREARMLREERFREWLETLVDKDVLFQALNTQLRLRKDHRYAGPREVFSLNDRYEHLAMRVEQFETGMQWTADPPERVRHHLSNIEVYQGDKANEIMVFANCWVSRNRRVYEEMTYSYGRKDVWRRAADGGLRLLHRLCDIDERFLTGKNLNFML
jgi:ethylbenzene dioxygenase subunit beta